MNGFRKAPARPARDFAGQLDTARADEAEEDRIGPGDLEIEFEFEGEPEKKRTDFRVD